VSYKQQLISELDGLDDSIITEVLDFLHFLKLKRTEDSEDILDARNALESVRMEGTVSWEVLKVEIGL